MRAPTVSILVAVLVAAVPAMAPAATFRAPVEPATIEPGCDYGDTRCLDTGRRHAGVDYLPDDSSEPILASADGVVRIAAAVGSDASHDFGNVVVLEHTLPGGARVSTVYAHMRERPSVAPGDCVAGGARLGTMGSTGAASNVHLHFEVKERATLGPPFGYTDGDPDEEGYRDPKSFVGVREALDVCADRPSECETGDPRSSLPAVVRGSRELRASGRLRRLAAGCRVQLSLVRRDLAEARCAFWRQSRRRMEWRVCDRPLWTAAAVARSAGVARWNHRFRARLVAGSYELSVRLVDRAGRPRVPAGRTAKAFALR